MSGVGGEGKKLYRMYLLILMKVCIKTSDIGRERLLSDCFCPRTQIDSNIRGDLEVQKV